MSVRERHKEARKRRIIAAAEALVRASGDIGFSMLELASLAKVSPATPYNLFGTKSEILYDLLNSYLDRLGEDLSRDSEADLVDQHPLDTFLSFIERAVDLFAMDPALFRPLFKFLLSVSDPQHRPAYLARSERHWDFALDRIASAIELDLPPRSFVEQYLTSVSLGVVGRWSMEELNREETIRHMKTTGLLFLFPFADEANRRCIQERLERTIPAGTKVAG